MPVDGQEAAGLRDYIQWWLGRLRRRRTLNQLAYRLGPGAAERRFRAENAVAWNPRPASL